MEDNLSNLTTITTAVYGSFSAFNLLLSITFLIIALAVIQPRRPDAAGWITVAAVVGLLGNLLPLANLLRPILERGDGSGSVESMLKVNLLMGGLGFLIHLVWFILLIIGLVALSRPAPTPRREPG